MLKRIIQSLRPLICPFEPIARHVPPGSSMLDLGCGTGAFLLHLAAEARIREGFGVDVSHRALAAAEATWQRRKSACPGTALAFGEVAALERLPGRKWDVVSMIDVLHHVPPIQQEDFVRSALGRVADGGMFLYKDMCRRPWWMAGLNRLHDLVLAQQWIHYVPVEGVIRWAGEAGFRCEPAECYRRFWYGHELVVCRRPGKDQ
jgi:2-polyprenyl-3-methyl-5-hydroxy-6-metoxy-1,4-benzoquinol methylase